MPCATEGKCNIHLRIDPERTSDVLDIPKLAKAIEESGKYPAAKTLPDLGLIKLGSGIADISILGSGRIVVKKADDREHAVKLLIPLAKLIKDSGSLT